jgi:hypothetical protein
MRNDLRQSFTPFEDGFGSEVLTLTPQNVKEIIGDRRSEALLPLLEQLKPRDSFAIQRHDFTVQDCRSKVSFLTASPTVGNFASSGS